MRRATVRPTGRPAYHTGFLSTLSLRRATLENPARAFLISYFYPRSPCGERLRPTGRPAYHTGFLSTLSLRRATRVARTPTMEVTISIHALLAESDSPSTFFYIILQNFYPRSPCGERPASSLPFRAVWIISIHALLAESDIFNTCRAKPIHAFLSTLSLRRAT